MLSHVLRWSVIIAISALVACGGDPKKDNPSAPAPKKETVAKKSKEEAPKEDASTNRRGRLIYKQHCNLCHGSDGKLGLSGATDLSTSTLSLDERIYQVTNGKGAMTPYKNILSESQIKAVSEYLEELR